MARRKVKTSGDKLNESLERLAKTIEKQLRRRVEKFAKAAESSIDRAAKRATQEATRQILSALNSAVRNVEDVAKQLGLNAQQESRLRQGLEATSGLVGGIKGVAPWAAIAPDVRLKGIILVVGAMIGAATGAAQEDIRKELARASREIEREKVDLKLLLSAVERDVERVRAMRRRTGTVG